MLREAIKKFLNTRPSLSRLVWRTPAPWGEDNQSTESENMLPYLKIKVKSLAAEARIIRLAERKLKKPKLLKTYKTVTVADKQVMERTPNPKYRPLPASLEACTDDYDRHRFRTFWGLREHRMMLRAESRASGLAYGFLRERDYATMEHYAHNKPNWDKIEKVALRFGEDERITKQRFAQWKADAEKWYEDYHPKRSGAA